MTHDLTKIETPFGLLDQKTRDALRNAAKGGADIERYDIDGWETVTPNWERNGVYRAAPQPVRGEVVVFGRKKVETWLIDRHHIQGDTHRITLPTLNGNLIPGTYTGPDGATITVECLK